MFSISLKSNVKDFGSDYSIYFLLILFTNCHQNWSVLNTLLKTVHYKVPSNMWEYELGSTHSFQSCCCKMMLIQILSNFNDISHFFCNTKVFVQGAQQPYVISFLFPSCPYIFLILDIFAALTGTKLYTRYLNFCSHAVIVLSDSSCKYSAVCAFPYVTIVSARKTYNRIIVDITPPIKIYLSNFPFRSIVHYSISLSYTLSSNFLQHLLCWEVSILVSVTKP